MYQDGKKKVVTPNHKPNFVSSSHLSEWHFNVVQTNHTLSISHEASISGVDTWPTSTYLICLTLAFTQMCDPEISRNNQTRMDGKKYNHQHSYVYFTVYLVLYIYIYDHMTAGVFKICVWHLIKIVVFFSLNSYCTWWRLAIGWSVILSMALSGTDWRYLPSMILCFRILKFPS